MTRKSAYRPLLVVGALAGILGGCYPAFDPIPVPSFAHADASQINDAALKDGWAFCTDAANAARQRAWDVHRRAFWSRRTGAVLTILAGSGATAASAGGRKDLATGLSAGTIVSGLFTSALVDDAQATAAEAAQQKSLTQLAAVRTSYQHYLEASAAEKPAALTTLVSALVDCGYNPSPAIR